MLKLLAYRIQQLGGERKPTIGELELQLRCENYASTECEREDPTENTDLAS